MKLSRFYAGFAVLSALLAIAIILIGRYFPDRHLLLDHIWGIYVFFAGTTFLAYMLGHIGIKKGSDMSVMLVLGGVGFKLLACMILALVYLYNFKVDKLVFLSNFFILYFTYTAFEIYSLMATLRAQKTT